MREVAGSVTFQLGRDNDQLALGSPLAQAAHGGGCELQFVQRKDPVDRAGFPRLPCHRCMTDGWQGTLETGRAWQVDSSSQGELHRAVQGASVIDDYSESDPQIENNDHAENAVLRRFEREIVILAVFQTVFGVRPTASRVTWSGAQ